MNTASRRVTRRIIATAIALSAVPAASRAQMVTMPDGRKVEFDKLPMVEKFPGRMKLGFRADREWTIVWTAPAFCPSAYGSASPWAYDRVQADCTKSSLSRLVDYGQAARDRCRCIKALETPSVGTLKAVHDIVNDPYYYTNMTLFVSKGDQREKLRGFVGRTKDGDARLYNEKHQLVCAGVGFLETDTVELRCFGGRVTATGTYRMIREKTSTADTYGIGSFQASDGSRLDIAANIIDSDLAIRHPRFPD